MALGSIDSPRPRGPFESRDAPLVQPRIVVAGSGGAADATQARASRRFLVRGTSSQPLRRPASVFESLLGDVDRRKQILETELSPWRMICALEIRGRNNATLIGTGWLASPRTVVTAGHCVFDPLELGGWATSITVVPGRDDEQQPFGSTRSARFSTSDGWLNAQDPDCDFAAIHLDADVGSAVGTFGIAVLPDAELADRLVNVAGYPVSPGNGRRQYFHANRVRGVTERRVFYDVDTMGGQSGSPVWAYLDDRTDVPSVIAIHAYGVGGMPSEIGSSANSGPRIVPDVMDLIQGWTSR